MDAEAPPAIRRAPGTTAALVLGVLATIGAAAFGITNLQTAFEVRGTPRPQAATAP